MGASLICRLLPLIATGQCILLLVRYNLVFHLINIEFVFSCLIFLSQGRAQFGWQFRIIWFSSGLQSAIHLVQLGALSLSLSHTHTHSLSLSHTHTLSLSLSLSLTQTHTHTHTLSLSLSLSHTHTHTHTHTLSLSLCEARLSWFCFRYS